ncbi:MAG: hypothetical protein JXB03_01130 [Spirochaetales bacterium]|nr:hypothetical protein [Spirochaetales bacterium]
MNQGKVRSSARKIRDVYNACFNYGWFYGILDELKLDPSVIRDVRAFIDRDPWDNMEDGELSRASDALDTLVAVLKNRLLPNIKELMRVSNLAPSLRITDRDQYLKMRLLIEVIPANIETLDLYAEELRRALFPEELHSLFDDVMILDTPVPVFAGK